MFNRKTLGATLIAAGALFTGAAQAGVHWSIGINLPAVTTVVSSPQPVYVEPQPVYVQPQPVYVQPAPVYVQRPPVVVYRPPVVYQPAPVIMNRPYCPPARHGDWSPGRGEWHRGGWNDTRYEEPPRGRWDGERHYRR